MAARRKISQARASRKKATRKGASGKKPTGRSRKTKRKRRKSIRSSSALLKLVALLLSNDPAARQRFNRNRDLVCREFGLSPEEQQAISSMKKGKIADAVAQQIATFKSDIKNYPMDEDEWPVEGEDFLPEMGTSKAEYPDPDPKVTRIRPARVRPGAWGKKGLEIVVCGQSFPKDVLVDVIRRDDGVAMKVTGAKVVGTLRCSRAVLTITQQTTDPDLDPGTYDVTLTVQPGTPYEEALPKASFVVLP